MPGIYPDTPATGLPAGGHIEPGETSLQAAARRYHERKRRESENSAQLDPEASRKESDPHSTEQPLVQPVEAPRQDSQNTVDSVGKPRRRSSLSKYWQGFKHNFDNFP